MTLSLVRANGWNYNEADEMGPEHWQDSYATCVGNQQSPIDIIENQARSDSKYNYVQTVEYDHSVNVDFTLVNNGHTAQFSTNTDKIRINGAGLPAEYVLEQFHFHWGVDDTIGSEHHVNGKSYPLEIHLVHRKSQYSSVNDALADPEGVAVLGIFATITTNEHDSVFTNLVSYLQQVPNKDDTTKVKSFPLHTFLPESHKYYRYKGSLTTPPCSQSVIWTVFAQPVKITSHQLEEFRKLHESPVEEITHNARPTQAMDGRTLYVGGL